MSLNPLEAGLAAAKGLLGQRIPPTLEGIAVEESVYTKEWVLTLGEKGDMFKFEDLEVPSDLVLGGTQMRAIHQFPGGARTIDVYGPRPRPIELRGQLYSKRLENGEVQTAIERMMILDRYRRDGKVRNLEYGPLFQHRVLVSDFSPTVHSNNHISFTLTLDVLLELFGDVDSWTRTKIDVLATPASIADLSLADMLNLLADAINLGAALTNLFTKLMTEAYYNPTKFLKKLVSILPALHPNVGAGLNLFNAWSNAVAASGDMTIAMLQIAADLAEAEPVSTLDPSDVATTILPGLRNLTRTGERVNAMILLGPLRARAIASLQPTSTEAIESGTATALVPVVAEIPPLGQISPEAAAFAATTGTAVLAESRNLTRRVATMVGLTAPNEIVTINPNLYAIAAAVYGSPVMWTAIAEANCLSTPLPTGVFDGTAMPKLKVPLLPLQDTPTSTRPVR